MKKILLFTTVFALQVSLQAQTVPNGTFESWNSVPYEEPNGWTTGNLYDIQRIGVPSVSKVPGYSGFAIRIQTNITASDTSESYTINTDNPCNDPSQWTGGVPYSQQPTAITGYYRYNLLGNDSALMIVIFRKNGAHIGDNFFLIKGTGSQSTFASFSFPLTCSGIPDSMIIAAASSNKASISPTTNGSFIELDNLAFTGTTQAIPGGTFENWTAKSYDNPVGWETWGNGVSMTTSSQAGTYAVRMETFIDNICDNSANSSGITLGQLTPNNGPTGGIPYTNTTDTLCGYYKYTAFGLDTAGIYVSLQKNGLPVGGNIKHLTPAAAYTYFELPFMAGITPDTMRIDAQSSEWPVSNSNAGSVLYLDNLFLKSSPLAIFNNNLTSLTSIHYPNPAKDFLSVKMHGNADSDWVTGIILFNSLGQQADIRYNATKDLVTLNVTTLPAGIYFYEIYTQGGVIRNKFVKE